MSKSGTIGFILCQTGLSKNIELVQHGHPRAILDNGDTLEKACLQHNILTISAITKELFS